MSTEQFKLNEEPKPDAPESQFLVRDVSPVSVRFGENKRVG